MISIEEYSFRKGGRERRFFPASLLFALHSTVSLTALHGMNIPMYTAIKVFSNHPSFILQRLKPLPIIGRRILIKFSTICRDVARPFPLF